MDESGSHLSALREELTRRGVRCTLDEDGLWPQLRIYCPGEGPSAGFDNNIVAATLAGQWFFWWPWAEVIGPVIRLRLVAATIIDDLGLGHDGLQDGTPPAITSLAMQRILRQAHAGFSCPGTSPPAGPPRVPRTIRRGRTGPAS